MNNRFGLFSMLIASLLLIQCEDPVLTPKPRGFPKVVFPQRGFQQFSADYCDMTFDYPVYAKIERNRYFFGEEAPNDCWFNIDFPTFNAKLHCSYLPIDKENTAQHLQKQAFKMTDWHNKKASYINEQLFENQKNAVGMTFDVEGPVASPFQFYLTDSLQQKHFFRGAFYFNTHMRPDSLAPIYNFIKADLIQMLNSFEWNK